MNPNSARTNRILFWVTAIAILATVAALATLIVLLWPPGLWVGLTLTAIVLLPLVAILALSWARRNRGWPMSLSAAEIIEMSDEELASHRLEIAADVERRLELRELKLARRVRTSQAWDADYIDLLEAEPSDEELGALAVKDLKLVALIEEESRLAFDRILVNRYAAEEGVNSGLILADLKDFIEKVAKLYRPHSEDILLHTELELIAKSLSSVSLRMLMVVDELPLNLKSYNMARMYRLIRRSASYYGTYKAIRPYLEHGMNAFQVSRIALGTNPLAAGALWFAGKLTTHGAKTMGERLLRRTALQLVNDFIQVIGFEAALMYGGGFQHRDANWVFGAALVNLEIARGDELAGRDAALRKLCKLALRNEFDRLHLLTSLSRKKPLDIARVRPAVVMTSDERQNVATELVGHCRDTGAVLDTPALMEWRETLQKDLGVELDLAAATRRTPRRYKQKAWRRALFGRRHD